MTWKKLNEGPEDDETYLVSYLKSNGTYSSPHRAYYDEEEDKFYSLENNNSHPLIVDIYFKYDLPS